MHRLEGDLTQALRGVSAPPELWDRVVGQTPSSAPDPSVRLFHDAKDTPRRPPGLLIHSRHPWGRQLWRQAGFFSRRWTLYRKPASKGGPPPKLAAPQSSTETKK